MPITVAVPPLRSMLNACCAVGRETDRLERVVDAAARELEHGADRVAGRRVDDVGGAERRARSRFDAMRSIAMTRPGADDRGGLDRVQADAAAADHRDVVAGSDLRGVDHRADAGRDPATDERGLVERHVGPDLHEHVLVHEQLLGEARQVEELEDRLDRRAAAAADRPGRPPRPDLVAEVRMTREAVAARAAEAADARDHVIAGLHVGDLRADRLDDAGRLVAEHRRHRARVLALHEVQVGVAQPRGGGLHQHLVRTDRADLHVVDDQLARDGLENRSFHRADNNEPDRTPPPRGNRNSRGVR